MNTNPLAALLLALPTCLAGAAGMTLRVMGQESLPPKWIFRNGAASGVCPDILAAIEKAEPRLHFGHTPDYRSVLVVEQGLQNGSVDAACALLDTPQRNAIAVRVGPPLYMVRQRLAAAAGDPADIRSLDNLVRQKALVNTSRGAAYIEQLRALGVEVDDSSGDNLINLKKILAGHGRFFYMNELTLHWLVRENRLQNKIKLMPAVLREDPIYFWVSRKAPAQAVELVDATLKKLAANGELAHIYARWAGQTLP